MSLPRHPTCVVLRARGLPARPSTVRVLVYRHDPVNIGLSGVVDLSAEWQHTCAVNAAGAVWCWGPQRGRPDRRRRPGAVGCSPGEDHALDREQAGDRQRFVSGPSLCVL
ncbi:MAG: hypothetical protein HOV81_30250 [Kofleriaceae bacterium]|nr:hypothetical protein [Kofleriaceae bacterium]